MKIDFNIMPTGDTLHFCSLSTRYHGQASFWGASRSSNIYHKALNFVWKCNFENKQVPLRWINALEYK
jgi:hypothetical protein